MLIGLAKINKYSQECTEMGTQSLLVEMQMDTTT